MHRRRLVHRPHVHLLAGPLGGRHESLADHPRRARPFRYLIGIGGAPGRPPGRRRRDRPGHLARPRRGGHPAAGDAAEPADTVVVERADQHPIRHPEAGDLGGHRLFDPPLLQVQVPADVGEGGHDVGEPGNTDPSAPQRESTFRVEVVGGVQGGQVAPLVVPHEAGAVGQGFEAVVVEHHHDPIGRHVQVGLDVAIAQIGGPLERHHRVLRPQHPAPPVGEAEGVLAGQIGAHGPRKIAPVAGRSRSTRRRPAFAPRASVPPPGGTAPARTRR